MITDKCILIYAMIFKIIIVLLLENLTWNFTYKVINHDASQ